MARTSKSSNGSNESAKPKRPPIRNPSGEIVPDDLVAKRAYELYEGRGGRHGADFDDWLEAERQIRQEQQSQGRRRTRAESGS